MRIQLGWGHLLVIFISHCGCCPSHRNIRAHKYIGFDHHTPLIGKISKQIRGSVSPSCLNILVCFASGFIEGLICNMFHQFGNRCCAGGNSLCITDISLLFCLSGLHFFGFNVSFHILLKMHRRNVISWHGSHNKGMQLRHHLRFPSFSAFFWL